MAHDVKHQLASLQQEMAWLQRDSDTIRGRAKLRYNAACGLEQEYLSVRNQQALEKVCTKMRANSDAQNALLTLA